MRKKSESRNHLKISILEDLVNHSEKILTLSKKNLEILIFTNSTKSYVNMSGMKWVMCSRACRIVLLIPAGNWFSKAQVWIKMPPRNK